MVAGTVSRLRAPWFDTIIPDTPALTACSASLGFKIPFSKMGIFVIDFIHSMSFQVTDNWSGWPGVGEMFTIYGAFRSAGNLNFTLSWRLRAPATGVSTVTHNALIPWASTF